MALVNINTRTESIVKFNLEFMGTMNINRIGSARATM